MPNTLVPLPAPEPGRMPHVCLVAGDAPAAVKIAPIVAAMRRSARVRPLVIACGDQTEEVVEALSAFGILPSLVVESTLDGQTTQGAAWLLNTLDRVYADLAPDAVFVQGDNAIAFSAAMAAFWRRIPVVHLDAGVRSHDLTAPFPQEGHRRLIAQISSLHLAATADAAANLACEAHGGPKVVTVGSTAVDAGFGAIERHHEHADDRVRALEEAVLHGGSRMVLVCLDSTRWSQDDLAAVLHGVADLVLATPDLEVVLPAAYDSELRLVADDVLGRLVRVTIIDPVDHTDQVCLLSIAAAVVTDSNVLAEQAPSFGVPVLVLVGGVGAWAEPERPGYPWTASPERGLVARIAEKLVLSQVERLAVPPAHNPFGDGFAAVRCEQAVEWLLGLRSRPREFAPEL
ncbi:UDP-N-acetylglucosamine 2-epimerase [Actinokineospora xionganensis]|uniref:UDP-N-acetylglucosamine 2-epimerase (non-hydrolyzing) n=1 Tax=Actinokineospora xionganensis TaxID=2684470 RepID=A0ABR7LC80_9PSEU|nr:UDP-N-acetylglucosamine 2-epimerase [Actinokineospora xionganensis]MBC6449902.1 UDP-N-acetylglucosamine 2-epimerase [Actinokineospora xionganensis]